MPDKNNYCALSKVKCMSGDVLFICCTGHLLSFLPFYLYYTLVTIQMATKPRDVFSSINSFYHVILTCVHEKDV